MDRSVARPPRTLDHDAYTRTGFKKGVNRATTQVLMKTGQVERTNDRDYETELRYAIPLPFPLLLPSPLPSPLPFPPT